MDDPKQCHLCCDDLGAMTAGSAADAAIRCQRAPERAQSRAKDSGTHSGFDIHALSQQAYPR
jgi:hypothetical protein